MNTNSLKHVVQLLESVSKGDKFYEAAMQILTSISEGGEFRDFETETDPKLLAKTYAHRYAQHKQGRVGMGESVEALRQYVSPIRIGSFKTHSVVSIFFLSSDLQRLVACMCVERGSLDEKTGDVP